MSAVQSPAPVRATIRDTATADRPSSAEATSTRRMPADYWLRAACVVVLAFLAGSEWHRVFGWGPVGVRVAVAAVLPVAIAVVSRYRRSTRPGLGVLVSLVVLVWFLAVGALGDRVGLVVPSADAPSGIVHGLVDGWAAILSVPLPVPAQGEYLVLPVALTWLAALVGAELVLRSRRPLAGAVPPAVAYALSLLFGIGSAGSRLVTSGVFLVVTLVLAGATARPIVPESGANRSGRRRRALEVAGCLAVVVLAAELLGPALPFVSTGHPYDPRASRLPPETPISTVNPLDELSAWALAPHGPALLTVHWSGPPQNLRLAVLDHYDPLDGWTQSSRFATAGAQLPASVPAGPTTTVRQNVQIDALAGPWLPAAVRPMQVGETGTAVDPSTGVLIATGPTRHLRYEVTSAVPRQNCTLDAAVPFAPDAAPSLPPAILSLADQYAGGATSPCARAAQLAAAFEQHFSYDPKAPSGSSIQVLENFLNGPKDDGGGTGTYEQAAAAYALMAEALGMPARVVVGFHAGHPLGHDTFQVNPDDAYAWVEIDFVGAGWVPFYPTLRNGPTPPADQADQGSSHLRQNPDQTAPTGGVPREKATPSQLNETSGSAWTVAAIVIGIALLVLLVFFLAVVVIVRAVRRRRRQRRRQVADPRQQVIGAWQESLDLLAGVGVHRRASATATEVVSAGTERLGPEAATPLSPLGRLSNAARFSDDPPDVVDADTAWACTDALSGLTGPALGRWGRLRRAVDLRVLFGRSDRASARRR